MSDELGKRLVRALITEKDLSLLTGAGVNETQFFDDAKIVFDWSLQFFRSTKEWPSVKQVEENTGILLPDSADALVYVVDLVRKRSLAKTLETEVKTVIKQLESRDPDEALRLLKQAAVKQSNQLTGVASFRGSGPDRYLKYQKLQTIGRLEGVPTPWQKLNDAILGWANGQLHVVLARQNIGKTWSVCIFADYALSLGRKVLVISLEMPVSRIERRLDALHYKIPFGDIRDVEIDMVTELRWKHQLQNTTSGRGDILIVDKQLVRYVSDAAALVFEHKPDLVFVDGGYRFEAKGRNDDWESSKQIVAELQRTAETTNIPWIVTTQQGDVSKNTRMEAQDRAFKVKYAKEWVINPDVVIELWQDEDMRILRQMEWKLLKEREAKGESGGKTEFRTEWDLTKMSFTQLRTAEDLDDFTNISVVY